MAGIRERVVVEETGGRAAVVEMAKGRAGRSRLWDGCGETPLGRPANSGADEGMSTSRGSSHAVPPVPHLNRTWLTNY